MIQRTTARSEMTPKISVTPVRNEDDDAKKLRQQEAMRENEANKRKTEEAKRKLFTGFRLWKACPDKRCMRAQACRGDTERCLRDRWRVLVPDDYRVLLGKALQLARDGMDWPQAVKAAQADLAYRKELTAKFAAEQAAAKPAAEPPAPAPVIRRSAPPRLYGPRVRSL